MICPCNANLDEHLAERKCASPVQARVNPVFVEKWTAEVRVKAGAEAVKVTAD